jgi:excinuclease UvrABC ATPase subunit
MAYWPHPKLRVFKEKVMSQKTCAACDYKLDANAIEVKIGGKTVEVCCDECAQKLKEAHVSATASRKG